MRPDVASLLLAQAIAQPPCAHGAVPMHPGPGASAPDSDRQGAIPDQVATGKHERDVSPPLSDSRIDKDRIWHMKRLRLARRDSVIVTHIYSDC